MSEGARHEYSFASLILRLSDQRRPTRSLAAEPERADEGGGPDVGRLEKRRSAGGRIGLGGGGFERTRS
jgi:hypothetical protein